MILYGLIVTGSEQRSDSPGKPIMAAEGEKMWVVVEPEGWVPATSRHFVDISMIPYDLKVWSTKKEAEDFGSKWKGHPWWCVPISYEVIKVEPKLKEVFDGYRIHGSE